LSQNYYIALWRIQGRSDEVMKSNYLEWIARKSLKG